MPTPPASHIYVYYRVAGDAALARATVAALMAEVEARTGVIGRLLARCDDPGTWMEVYEPVADMNDFLAALASLARDHRVAAIAAGGVRHTECFAPPPSFAAVAPPAPHVPSRRPAR
jgi:hypothetical protein